MKKLTSLFILLFTIQSVSAQIYLTGGVSRSQEGAGYNDPKIYQDVFSSSNEHLYRYDFYEFGVVLKNEGFLIEGNLGLTYNNLDVLEINSTNSYNGGLSQSGSNTTHYRTYNVKFAYLGPKFVLSKVFFHKKNFNLNLGGFMNAEVLLGEKESNYSDSTVSSWYNYSYNQTTMQQEYHSGSSYKVSDQEFDEFQARGPLLSFGLTLSPSYAINRFRIAASFSFGVNFEYRTSVRSYPWLSFKDEERKVLYPKFGISVGYQLD